MVYKDENIWATQVAIGELFGVEAKTIGFHLQNIFQEGELQQDRTTQKIGVVQMEGTRKVNREPMFYNLDAIISVGYRVIQDRLFASDFDKLSSGMLLELPFEEE